MRLITLYIIVFLFSAVPINLSGQITFQDSSEAYQYWAKKGIIKMMYAYMEDFKPQRENEKRGKENYKAEFVEGIDKKSKDEINSDFENIERFLNSNSWSITATQILKPLITNYDNYNNIDSAFFSIDGKGQGYREKGNKCFENQEIIINGYRAALRKFTETKVVPDTPDSSKHSPANTYTETQVEKQDKSEVKNYWGFVFNAIIFLSGGFIGGIIIYIVFKKQIYSILDYEKGKYFNELNDTEKYFPKWLGMIELLKSSKDRYKAQSEKNNNQLESLRQEIDKLSRENEDLRKQLLHKEQSQTVDDNQSKVSEFRVERKEISLTNLYFSIPDNEGRFMIENGKINNDGNNFYRIEYEENKPTGTVHFISGELDKRAIEGIDHYLGPVCEIENISNRKNANRVQVLDTGKVFLKNDCWIIDPENKVKIKLV